MMPYAWVVVFFEDGTQATILRTYGELETEIIVAHNKYYGRRSLVVRMKECK